MKPARIVITGGPSVGKAEVFRCLRDQGYRCSEREIARDIYREHKARLGRHLEAKDRLAYSKSVLAAFVDEYRAHGEGLYFCNRGIPDGIGWDRFFGLEPSPELLEASRTMRYDGVFVLDPLHKFEDEGDVVWTSEREAARVHQGIVQGYVDVGYRPIFVPSDFVERRVQFILANV